MLTLWRVTERLAVMAVGLRLTYVSILSGQIDWLGLAAGVLLLSLGTQILLCRGFARALALWGIGDIVPRHYPEYTDMGYIVEREIARLRSEVELAKNQQRRKLNSKLDAAIRQRANLEAASAVYRTKQLSQNDPISLRIKWGLPY